MFTYELMREQDIDIEEFSQTLDKYLKNTEFIDRVKEIYNSDFKELLWDLGTIASKIVVTKPEKVVIDKRPEQLLREIVGIIENLDKELKEVQASIKKSMASSVKDNRARLRLSLKSLAELSDVGPASINQIENEKFGIPSEDMQTKLSIGLDISFEELAPQRPQERILKKAILDGRRLFGLMVILTHEAYNISIASKDDPDAYTSKGRSELSITKIKKIASRISSQVKDLTPGVAAESVNEQCLLRQTRLADQAIGREFRREREQKGLFIEDIKEDFPLLRGISLNALELGYLEARPEKVLNTFAFALGTTLDKLKEPIQAVLIKEQLLREKLKDKQEQARNSLVRLRENKGLLRVGLVRRTGYGDFLLGSLENGATPIASRHRPILAKGLNVDIGSLWPKEDLVEFHFGDVSQDTRDTQWLNILSERGLQKLFKEHTQRNVNVGRYFAEKEGLNEREKEILEVALWLHDISKNRLLEDYIPGEEGLSGMLRLLIHHLEGAETAEKTLKELGYDREFIAQVKDIIIRHMGPIAGKERLGFMEFRRSEDLGKIEEAFKNSNIDGTRRNKLSRYIKELKKGFPEPKTKLEQIARDIDLLDLAADGVIKIIHIRQIDPSPVYFKDGKRESIGESFNSAMKSAEDVQENLYTPTAKSIIENLLKRLTGFREYMKGDNEEDTDFFLLLNGTLEAEVKLERFNELYNTYVKENQLPYDLVLNGNAQHLTEEDFISIFSTDRQEIFKLKSFYETLVMLVKEERWQEGEAISIDMMGLIREEWKNSNPIDSTLHVLGNTFTFASEDNKEIDLANIVNSFTWAYQAYSLAKEMNLGTDKQEANLKRTSDTLINTLSFILSFLEMDTLPATMAVTNYGNEIRILDLAKIKSLQKETSQQLKIETVYVDFVKDEEPSIDNTHFNYKDIMSNNVLGIFKAVGYEDELAVFSGNVILNLGSGSNPISWENFINVDENRQMKAYGSRFFAGDYLEDDFMARLRQNGLKPQERIKAILLYNSWDYITKIYLEADLINIPDTTTREKLAFRMHFNKIWDNIVPNGRDFVFLDYMPPNVYRHPASSEEIVLTIEEIIKKIGRGKIEKIIRIKDRKSGKIVGLLVRKRPSTNLQIERVFNRNIDSAL